MIIFKLNPLMCCKSGDNESSGGGAPAGGYTVDGQGNVQGPQTTQRQALDAINATDKANGGPGYSGSSSGGSGAGPSAVSTPSGSVAPVAPAGVSAPGASTPTAKGLLSRNKETIQANLQAANDEAPQEDDVVGAVGPADSYQAPVTRADQRAMDAFNHSEEGKAGAEDFRNRVDEYNEANNTNKYDFFSMETLKQAGTKGGIAALMSGNVQAVIPAAVMSAATTGFKDIFEALGNKMNNISAEDYGGTAVTENKAPKNFSAAAPNDGRDPDGSGRSDGGMPVGAPAAVTTPAAPVQTNTPGAIPASMSAAMGLLKERSISNNIKGLLSQKYAGGR